MEKGIDQTRLHIYFVVANKYCRGPCRWSSIPCSCPAVKDLGSIFNVPFEIYGLLWDEIWQKGLASSLFYFIFGEMYFSRKVQR